MCSQVSSNSYFSNSKLTKTLVFLLRNKKSIMKQINFLFPEEKIFLLFWYPLVKLKFYINYSLVPVGVFATTSKKNKHAWYIFTECSYLLTAHKKWEVKFTLCLGFTSVLTSTTSPVSTLIKSIWLKKYLPMWYLILPMLLPNKPILVSNCLPTWKIVNFMGCTLTFISEDIIFPLLTDSLKLPHLP